MIGSVALKSDATPIACLVQPGFGVAAPRSWSGRGSLTIEEQPPGLFETAADIYDDIDVYDIDGCFWFLK